MFKEFLERLLSGGGGNPAQMSSPQGGAQQLPDEELLQLFLQLFERLQSNSAPSDGPFQPSSRLDPSQGVVGGAGPFAQALANQGEMPF